MNLQQENFFLKKFPQVGEGSSEWIQLEYDLQLGLGSISAVIKDIKAINNQSLQFQFQKHNQNRLILESWIDYEELEQSQKIDEMCYKGFEFKDPQKGHVFPTGYIELRDNSESKKQHTVIMFKIAVGRSQCIPYRKEEIQSRDYLKDKNSNFDSLYLYDEANDQQGSVFLHRYVLFDKEQVLPMYQIKFEFDDSKEKDLQPLTCDNQCSNKAKFYCKNDDAYFCHDCNFDIHNNNQQTFNQKHHTIEISKKEKSFGNCKVSDHQGTKLELYCMICHEALCVYCKIQGSHSQGEPAAHQLLRISDAYKKALHESKVLDPQLEKRKNELTDHLTNIDQKIKDVSSKSKNIEDRIYKLLEDGLKLLQQKTKEKMCILIGDQLELKRQYDQIQWIESFLKYQQNVLNPAEYLKAWSRHSQLRNKIISADKYQIEEISSDIHMDAQPIKITSENNVQSSQNKQNQQDPNENQSNVLRGNPSSQFRSQILGNNKNSSAKDKNVSMSNFVVNNNTSRNQIKGQSTLQTIGIMNNGATSSEGA
ncbi:B-box zinc finger protein (macronuclear) [Tetrahymena thermophila SB210]|uniref:B-box zinc finger protein n=1 Tax=Tetrahymena thermophila (strain SB210) TaxID=312017 RepID=I7LZP4_TETTS|nr:B-box zinc finger protein [Tetrahymena thermophila SB210]EAR84469.2 B-box zinc finger protein [Tetrahymena thermophila SB210]|eukprot:XP_001032132.2 B-box zinc finger protein [Tetrahymena thermophila SB210]